jgi:hypothetical protein
MISAVAMAVGAAVAASAAREYTPLEVQHIQVACTLTPAIYEADLPEVFMHMLKEGHTKIRTHAIMRELLAPDDKDMFNAIQVLVTEEMAKDFKKLDLGFNGDAS